MIFGQSLDHHQVNLLINESFDVTIKCGSLLKLKDNTPQDTTQIIKDFMTPLRPQLKDDSDKTVDRELHEKLLRVCNDAFDLTLTLRRCKDIYRCEFPKHEEPNHNKDSEVQARERRIGSMDGVSGAEERRVAIITSGTLAKYPGGNMEKRLVLEKAHVVVR